MGKSSDHNWENIKEKRGHSLKTETSTPLINMTAKEWIKTFVKTKKKKGTEIPKDTDHYFNQWMIQSSNIYPLLWSSTKLSWLIKKINLTN